MLAVLPALALAGSGVPASASAQEASDACPRKGAGIPLSERITVVRDADPPCRLVFRRTGVTLEGTADGSHPDPGMTVVRDRRGRFYSANAVGDESAISVWSPAGEYLTSFGRRGDGPGEFGGVGALSLYVDQHDQLHVRDGGLYWSVFSANHEFERRSLIRVPGGLLDERMTVILDSGEALTSASVRGDRESYFHVLNSDGTLDRSFGPVDPELARKRLSGRPWPLRRTISYHSGEIFWAGPILEDRDAEGYVVEEWSTDGELLHAFRRHASWYGWDGDMPPPGAPHFRFVEETGLVYLMFVRLTPEGTRILRERGHIDRESRNRLSEAIVEVIDTRSGELLASEIHANARDFMPVALFRGSMQGYLYSETSVGVPVVEIVSVELEAK